MSWKALFAVAAAILVGVWKGKQRPSLDNTDNLDEPFDFIVVGGGTAGLVVANRLTENADFRVLVLEAGSDDRAILEASIPLAHKKLQMMPGSDWQYLTEPDEKALGYLDGVRAWPRGKLLGGCSSINYMHYIRGNKGDFDSWAASGADGWAYDDVLPYFKKFEANKRPSLASDPYHGTAGPFEITDHKHKDFAQRVCKAAVQAGIPYNHDVNGASQLGCTLTQAAIDSNGRRVSSATAYLHPILDRANLRVVTHAHVTKVVFDGDRRATGVKFVDVRGVEHLVSASKEVILSGGAIGSPHTLLLSGVGPKKQLEEHGIEVVADVPAVGQNLQDHLMLPFVYPVDKRERVYGDWVETPANILNWLVRGEGPLTSSALEASIFLQTGNRPDLGETVPDFQGLVFSGGTSPVEESWYTKIFRFNLTYSSPFGPTPGGMLISGLIHPKSMGEVRLKSADPFDHPIIDPRYLTHPDDLRSMVLGTRKMLELPQHSALKDILLSTRPSLPDDDVDIFSEEFIVDRWKTYAATIYHPTSTCKMGAQDDDAAVVDPALKVRGVSGLRVIDASVMPSITSGNTFAPTVMIGEKGADLIKADYVS